MDDVVAAAVFMDPGPCIERRLIHIETRARSVSLHYDVATAFFGPQFQPVNVVAIKRWLTQADRPFNDQI
jgi:hypothetical protein